MNRPLRIAAAVLCLASPALAGGPTLVDEPVVLPPPPEAMPRPDWTGPYAGLGLGRTTGSQDDQTPSASYGVDGGSLRSVFLGYRLQQGNIVYGGEMELANLSGSAIQGTPREFSKAFDVKSTLGIAQGRFLTYGVLGWSQVEVARPSDTTNFGGISYGAGVEYSVNDRFGIGLEYLARDVDGISVNGSPQTSEIGLDSLSLRFGLSF
ncbi:outer membrane protein [Tabrizicola sp.]|uniref:outer membrane protein n=1 Tax=Tabrizicola sp. TaxID=2005166 RepID=UPI002FDEBFDB